MIGLLLGISAFMTLPNISYKCMIQMTNYSGEKAYVVVSLINPEAITKKPYMYRVMMQNGSQT